jgi:hypothetical protein
MPQQQRVTIRHPKTGAEYLIEPKDFTVKDVSPEKESYADQGFDIVGYANGEPYEGPKNQREIEQAAEARVAAREAAAPAKAEPKGKGD